MIFVDLVTNLHQSTHLRLLIIFLNEMIDLFLKVNSVFERWQLRSLIDLRAGRRQRMY